MSELLILTVGTGTAGKFSNVAEGLANTIRLLRPRLFWLVPSASERSHPVADLIREMVADLKSFAPASDDAAYHAIGNPDDIHECRRVIGEVIARVKPQVRPGELLVVNPTSGTKQMSAGATLAALDAEVDRLDFTVGQRADGVVKTGTETLQPFDVREFLLQRDLRTAQELFHHGAFAGAARVLKSYSQPEAMRARETALCLHEWQRLNHARAARHAARFSEKLRHHLKHLAQADEFSTERLGDLLASADELLRWGDCEEALARYYRGAEQAAKVRLALEHNLRPPYDRQAVLHLLPAGCDLAKHLQSQRRHEDLNLTAQRAWEILRAVQDPMAVAWFADRELQKGIQQRHLTMYGHGQGSIDRGQVQSVADRLRNLLRDGLPQALEVWNARKRPTGFDF